MWDGEWNSGKGIHDSNAVVWKDLIGERDASLSGSYEWKDNCWSVSSVTGEGLATWMGENLPSTQTWEIVVHPIAASAYGRLIAEAQSIASPVIRNYSTMVYMYGYGMDTGVYVSNFSQFDAHTHTIVHPSGGPMNYYIDRSLVWERSTTNDSTGTTYGYFGNRPNLDRGIDAKYYCVRLYNRALTTEEISANYEVDKQRFNLLTT